MVAPPPPLHLLPAVALAVLAVALAPAALPHLAPVPALAALVAPANS